MSYYSQKLENIREILQSNVYPPKFNAKRWKHVKVNCYAYALDLPINDKEKLIFIPGRICDKNAEKVIWTDVTSKVKRDLESLGISYREDDGILYEGEWRIAIYYIPTPHDYPISFHFVRQDDDGFWSEKPSWEAKIRRFLQKTDTPPDLSEYGPKLESVLILSK
ncbi:MAG: hypothetical protein J6A04_03815 [Clostridia bacterium]|nr:hypothetical protein [Clostridia bacterium]